MGQSGYNPALESNVGIMVDLLRYKGITDEFVLKAIYEIPRELFMPQQLQKKALMMDKAFPIGEGQTISQPYTVAYQTQLLHIEAMDKSIRDRYRKCLPGSYIVCDWCNSIYY